MEQPLVESNRKLVSRFFVALETQEFEMLKKVFAPDGIQWSPYSPEGSPKKL